MPKLSVNDIDLHYEISGQGEPLLFIHGLGSSARDWEYQVSFFSEQYRVITFDLRGHGQSQKPAGPYSMSLFADDTAELIELLGVAPVHVVGISLGGMIAFQLAVDHPDLIKSLVIANAWTEVVPRTLKDHWNVFMRFAVARLFGMRKTGEVLSKRLFPKEEQAELKKLFIEHWAENNKQAYLDTLHAIVGWSVMDHIDKIGSPTLVLTAEYDYTPISDKEAVVAKMPQAELVVIPNSRHATPVDSPREFNEAVFSFLSKLGSDM
jgi:pimeloyl-ACP methyl ester carboxylesterase